MSSELSRTAASAPVPLPRTAVPLGIDDPVERARAELKAALAAIEVKANVPRRIAVATEKATARARTFARRNPSVTMIAVAGVAAAIGLAVWGAVRAYVR
jgi:hypothetical protein